MKRKDAKHKRHRKKQESDRSSSEDSSIAPAAAPKKRTRQSAAVPTPTQNPYLPTQSARISPSSAHQRHRETQRPRTHDLEQEKANTNVSELIDIRLKAMDDIRNRLIANRALARDTRTRLSEVAMVLQYDSDSTRTAQRQRQHKDLKQEIQQLTVEEDQLAVLLNRLGFLKELFASTGIPSRCEQCQKDIRKQDLLYSAAQASTWDVGLALLLCPECAEQEEQ